MKYVINSLLQVHLISCTFLQKWAPPLLLREYRAENAINLDLNIILILVTF